MEPTIKQVDCRFKELCQTNMHGGQIHAVLVSEFGRDAVQRHTEWQIEQMSANDTPASKSKRMSHVKTRIENEH